MKKIRINVTVSDATPSKLKSVKQKLVQQGVDVESTLEAIGIITGKVAQSRLASLKPGTGATVEVDEAVQLPPPDAPEQ